jgi:hypothetical protein
MSNTRQPEPHLQDTGLARLSQGDQKGFATDQPSMGCCSISVSQSETKVGPDRRPVRFRIAPDRAQQGL